MTENEAIERQERDQSIAFLLGQLSGGLLGLRNSCESKEQIIGKIEGLLDLLNVSIGRIYYKPEVKNENITS